MIRKVMKAIALCGRDARYGRVLMRVLVWQRVVLGKQERFSPERGLVRQEELP
ncbi:MAG: hypothetical protein WBI82_16695 [Sphaerochaeta sp.]|jgi:hypothetical protein